MRHSTPKSERHTYAVGDRVWFDDGHKRPYVVRAVSPDQRFVICTKPFNARKTVIYSIIDHDRNVRGPDNLVFCMGYETPEHITQRMEDLISGDAEVSRRREAPLVVTRHEKAASFVTHLGVMEEGHRRIGVEMGRYFTDDEE